MASLTQSLQIYRDLADAYEQLGQVTMRDRFLMLAADAAHQLNQPQEAERLRQRLLTGSRHHMLRPYASFAEALTAPDVQTYLRDLRLNYPPDVAEQMLASLQGVGGPVHHAQQPPFGESSPPVPVTAPLLDLDSPSPALGRGRSPRPTALPAETYPLADAPERPLDQTMPPPRPAARSPVDRPPAPARAPAAPPPEPRPPATKEPRNRARWFNAVLAILLLLAALAVAAFTVARPFLPEGWLP